MESRRYRASLCIGIAACVLSLLVPGVRVHAADEWRALRREGLRHYEARSYFGAIDALERAIAVAPEGERESLRRDLAQARAGWGLELLNSGESEEARKAFEAAIGVADHYFARFGLGYLHFLRRDDAMSLSHLIESERLNPEYAFTQKLLAFLEYRRGDTPAAIERLAGVQKLDPKDSEARDLVTRWRAELAVIRSFREQRSKRFVVRIDPLLDTADADRLVASLESAREELGERLGVWSVARVPAVLFEESRFHRATGLAHWVGGVYDGQLKVPVPVGKLRTPAEREAFDAVVRHELTHFLVRSVAPECPTWLNEGIAQYLERPVEFAALRGRLRARRDQRIELRAMPAQLGAIDDVELARWIYLQSLGFVSFLAERYGSFRMRLCLRALDEEHSVARGFQRAYGRSLEDLEKLWWDAIEAESEEPAAEGSRRAAADGGSR